MTSSNCRRERRGHPVPRRGGRPWWTVPPPLARRGVGGTGGCEGAPVQAGGDDVQGIVEPSAVPTGYASPTWQSGHGRRSGRVYRVGGGDSVWLRSPRGSRPAEHRHGRRPARPDGPRLVVLDTRRGAGGAVLPQVSGASDVRPMAALRKRWQSHEERDSPCARRPQYGVRYHALCHR